MAAKPEKKKKEPEIMTTHAFLMPMSSIKELHEIMKSRGFPKKPLSEGDIVAEAIHKLHETIK